MLTPGAGDCEPCLDADQILAAVKARPETIIVYNQHADALAPVNDLQVTASQIFIEIRQDTRGVPGLQALRRRDLDKKTLEPIYEQR